MQTLIDNLGPKEKFGETLKLIQSLQGPGNSTVTVDFGEEVKFVNDQFIAPALWIVGNKMYVTESILTPKAIKIQEILTDYFKECGIELEIITK